MTTGPLDDPASLIRTELEHGLHELDPVRFEPEHQLSEDGLHAVAWTYVAKPRPKTPFLGVQLSEELTLRGVTLVRRDDGGQVLLRWYIDWLDALNRAGLNAALRPVPDGPQPDLSQLRALLS